MNWMTSAAQFLMQSIGISKIQHSGTSMIKEAIQETSAAIELKLNKLFFAVVASLVFALILAYSFIKLIWYFESYLTFNYGTQFAALLVGVVFLLASAQMLYVKYFYDRSVLEKRQLEMRKDLAQESLELSFSPERIINQAWVGFMHGFRQSRN